MPIDLSFTDTFDQRHIGPSDADVDAMLDTLGYESLDALVDATIPDSIRTDEPLDLPPALTEQQVLDEAQARGEDNENWRSFIGMGYHGTHTPPVIQRNILENPAWYTQYTPYQSEIAQGRLQALLNFQDMTIDLTGMEIANASLLDEATAAAEAMMMLNRVDRRSDASTFYVAEDCHPQTIEVVKGRAEPIGVDIIVEDPENFVFGEDTYGCLLQYPTTDGAVRDYRDVAERAHDADAYVAVAADLLSLTLLEAPGEWGADVVVGSSQRFGVPMGYGGPHAAYFATREDFQRQVPGRMIGVTKDADGEMALRMALQTREQHIRRGRATSNICTSQVLLAVMASMYAVYHGPEGLRRIATSIHGWTKVLAGGLRRAGHCVRHSDFFDTVRVEPVGLGPQEIRDRATARRINLRYFEDGSVGVAFDETVGREDVEDVLAVFSRDGSSNGEFLDVRQIAEEIDASYEGPHARQTSYLDHPTFHRYRSETELMRYARRLASTDVSLTDSMIPLGSCTMKLNGAAALEPLSWPAFGAVHPFAPPEQAEGVHEEIGRAHV